jgi:lysozyme family protein
MSDYKLYLTFTKQAEGGLSKAKTDTASSDPVPDGSGYHTNKGITWATFKRYAPILAYTATPALFYLMPEKIFLGIFEGYWKSAGANLIKSQAMATIIFQAMWGGGYSALVKDIQNYLMKYGYSKVSADGGIGTNTAGAINNYCLTKGKEKLLYDYSFDERLKYLRSLASYAANGNGWESRMKLLYTYSIGLITSKAAIGFGFFLLRL